MQSEYSFYKTNPFFLFCGIGSVTEQAKVSRTNRVGTRAQGQKLEGTKILFQKWRKASYGFFLYPKVLEHYLLASVDASITNVGEEINRAFE